MYLPDLMLFISYAENLSENIKASGRESFINSLPAGRQALLFKYKIPQISDLEGYASGLDPLCQE